MRSQEAHPCPAFVAAQIKYWRNEKGITQKDLSNISGIKYRHLQEIEAGRVDMKLRTLGMIAMSLEVRLDILLKPVEANRSIMCESCKDLV